MKLKLLYLLLATGLLSISCTQKLQLLNDFNCERTLKEFKTKQLKDFKNNFKLRYPKSWKSKLYYDDFQSEIMIADTLKPLSNSFIYDASWNHGEIEINNEFESTINAKVKTKDNLNLLKSGASFFKKKPYYWHLLNGTKNKRPYHLFKAYVKTGVDTYLMLAIDIYGNEAVEERLCLALEIFETTEFL